MDRMVVKGLLAAEKVRNLTIYRSAVTREQAQRGELFYALKHAFNGALTPMVQCLLDTGNLSADELAELESLIKAKKKGAKKPADPHPPTHNMNSLIETLNAWADHALRFAWPMLWQSSLLIGVAVRSGLADQAESAPGSALRLVAGRARKAVAAAIACAYRPAPAGGCARQKQRRQDLAHLRWS